MRRNAILGLLATCLLATGCVPALVRDRAMEPDTATPATFPGQAPTDDGLGTRPWTDVFVSPSLRALVDEALKRNQELNLQLQELIIARNEVAARRGEYMPKARAQLGAGIEERDFKFGLVGSWEVDVWGKLRNEAAAAGFRYQATVEGRYFVVTQIVAELARSYYDLLALDTKLAVLRRNIAIQVQALALVKLEKQAARVTELAVQRFEAELAKNRGARSDLEQERVQVENRINFLVGRYPRPVARRAQELDAPLPPLLRAGLPSALLTNRPDVRQAERELQAAKVDVDAARAAFFPALSIDASLGFDAFNPAHLLEAPASLAYGLGGGLTAPVLIRAAIEAQYRSADARQVQAIIKYERALLQAYTDVTNQLANLANMKAAYEGRSQQAKRLSKAVEMSTVLFRAARADYVEVLLTRRDLLEAEMEVIERRKLMQQAVINLYQALGGGWRPVAG